MSERLNSSVDIVKMVYCDTGKNIDLFCIIAILNFWMGANTIKPLGTTCKSMGFSAWHIVNMLCSK